MSDSPLRRRKFATYMRNNYILYLFLLPPAIYFIIFKYIPMFGVIIAFKDFNIFEGVMKSKWIGFSAFKEIFAMEDFWQVLRNTFTLNLLDLVFGFPLPIIIAILLNEIKITWFKKVTQTVLYLPHFLSWIVIGGLALELFATDTGFINIALQKFGLSQIPFLSNKWWWLFTYVLLGIWQSAGWNTIIYLAAITGINPELYEAAAIDGATRSQRIWHVTLPSIKPTIVIMLILNLGRMVSIGFDRPYVLGNNMVMEFSDVISTFVYRVGLQSGQYTIATAVGLFQSVIGMIFLLTANYAAQKIGEQGIFV